MNQVSQGGLLIARQIASAYRANPNVGATMLGGSAARGYADQYSDLEIGVFWEKPPSDQERRSAIATVGGDLGLFNSYDAETETVAGEHYGLDHVTIDNVHCTGTLMVSANHLTSVAVERCLAEVLDAYDTALPKHILLSAVQDGIPLFGDGLIAQWQERIRTFPDRLAIKVIQENLWCGPWFVPQAYVQRDDQLVLYQHFIWMQQSVLKVLAALNRSFLPSVEYKWTDQLISRLALAPDDLARRMKSVFSEAPAEAVHTMLSVIDDTIALVEQHLPEVNRVVMFTEHPEVNTEWARQRWKEWSPYTLMTAAGVISTRESIECDGPSDQLDVSA